MVIDWKMWLIGHLIILSAVFLSWLLGHLSSILPFILGMILFVVMICYALLPYGKGKRVRIVILALLIPMIGAILGMVYQDYEELESGEIVRGVGLSEIKSAKNLSAIYFNEGAVQVDYLYGYKTEDLSIWAPGTIVGEETYTFYFVAPVVSSGWEKSEPVNTWAACYIFYRTPVVREWIDKLYSTIKGKKEGEEISNIDYQVEECKREMAVPYQAGQVERTYPAEDYFKIAVNGAEEYYGLRSTENPIIIYWMEDPEKFIKESSPKVVGIGIWFSLLWLAVFWAGEGYQLIRKKIKREKKGK